MNESPQLAGWLARLEALHPTEIELGLERVTLVAQRMGLLALAENPAITIVTIAGTNGKGSCVATLEALGLARGMSVGAYTSPHLLHYGERIRIGGTPVADDLVCDAFAAIDQARGDISLTYFEFGTLAALEVFRRQDVRLILLEVGLGGRLDATNIIDSDIAVITSIDIDHEAWLGNNREIIGVEKAGIARAGRPVVSADPQPPQSISTSTNNVGARLWQVGEQWHWRVADEHWSLILRDETGAVEMLNQLPLPQLPLPSVAAGLQVAHLLGWSLDEVWIRSQLLPQLTLSGRCQQLSYAGREVLLDVAHNPAAAKLLALSLRSLPAAGKTFAVFGVMVDKDIDGLLAPLWGQVDGWFVCDLPGNSRAASASVLAQVLHRLMLANQEQKPLSACSTVAEGLQQAVSLTGPDDRILVMGSFFTVADALREISGQDANAAV